jgi:outer membrane protein OmpA-like peptidoglycan-associated protein
MLDRTADMPDGAWPRRNEFLRAILAGATTEAATRRPDPCRIAGEDVASWLAVLFAVIGAMIAVASASAWQIAALSGEQAASVQAASDFAAPVREGLPTSAPALERENLIQSQPPPAAVTPAPSAVAAPPPSRPVSAEPTPIVGTALPPAPAGKPATADCFSALTIPFLRNSARPNVDDVRKSAGPLRRWLASHGDAIVVIEGHSDTAGTEDYNVLLSYSRAKAIAALLKREGIPSQQMIVRAAGASEATGIIMELASDRNAVLRIAGAENCAGTERAPRTE